MGGNMSPTGKACSYRKRLNEITQTEGRLGMSKPKEVKESSDNNTAETMQPTRRRKLLQETYKTNIKMSVDLRQREKYIQAQQWSKACKGLIVPKWEVLKKYLCASNEEHTPSSSKKQCRKTAIPYKLLGGQFE